jgi:uncharacterized protein YcaQ
MDGAETTEHWAEPRVLDEATPEPGEAVHVLSPFDPLVIQRKRLKLFFGYEHRFEAYVPKQKRQYGYFALPILLGDEMVAVIDLKADRTKRELLVQQWAWVGQGSAAHQSRIEQALQCFEAFQFASQSGGVQE